MTYLEAAITILKDADASLHYREITERALARQLIEPKGQTPEATMGAQLYLAAKREDGPPVSDLPDFFGPAIIGGWRPGWTGHLLSAVLRSAL